MLWLDGDLIRSLMLSFAFRGRVFRWAVAYLSWTWRTAHFHILSSLVRLFLIFLRREVLHYLCVVALERVIPVQLCFYSVVWILEGIALRELVLSWLPAPQVSSKVVSWWLRSLPCILLESKNDIRHSVNLDKLRSASRLILHLLLHIIAHTFLLPTTSLLALDLLQALDSLLARMTSNAPMHLRVFPFLF